MDRPVLAGFGGFRSGKAGKAWLGLHRIGVVRLGTAGEAWTGRVWRGEHGLAGMARLGIAW